MTLRGALLRVGILAAGAALILAIFGLGGADRALTGLFYDPLGGRFPLKDVWLLAVPGHTGIKWTALAFWGLCLALGGAFRRGALYAGAIVLAVELLKHFSPYSCPWDLPEYGGRQPQAGQCLPAAHPLSGFAFFGLYLALRDSRPRAAGAVLAAACAVGVTAGAIQIARGAHFASHVLWTAWVAWAVTLLLAALMRKKRLEGGGFGPILP